MTQHVKSTQGIRKNLRNENDPYLLPKGKGMKEPLRCKGCGFIYWNKRWYRENEAKRLYGDRKIQGEIRCPACRKKADNVPMGLVTLAGSFLEEHSDEIFNLIRNEEQKVMNHNALDRIVNIKKIKGGVEITTTTERLAQRLGKAVHRAYSGNLQYSFSDGVKFARVSWSRNNHVQQ
jgi:NMD protein affecting ribosome stability and mRNA decay